VELPPWSGKVSPGQSKLYPVHTSAVSHSSRAGRQVTSSSSVAMRHSTQHAVGSLKLEHSAPAASLQVAPSQQGPISLQSESPQSHSSPGPSAASPQMAAATSTGTSLMQPGPNSPPRNAENSLWLHDENLGSERPPELATAAMRKPLWGQPSPS